MDQALWTSTDRYFLSRLGDGGPELQRALEASHAAGLPQIAVSAAQGKLLMILAQSLGARRILEIGTLGGYSALWLARGLRPGGRLITLELEPRHAAVAVATFEAAGLSATIEVRLGPALTSLASLDEDGGEPFDLAFIDADKSSNAEYFEMTLKMTRPGGLIVVDNVVRGGRVIEEASSDPAILGVRRLVERMAAEPQVEATVVQTVGEKGHDGFLVARVAQSRRA